MSIDKLFQKAMKAAKASKGHGVELTKIGGVPQDWMSKDGKWTISVDGGHIRIDNRHHAETYFGRVNMVGEITFNDNRKLPKNVLTQLKKMVSNQPVSVPSSWTHKTHGVSARSLTAKPRWTQVGGDMNPKDHGAVLALNEGTSVTIIDIEPNEEGPGWHVTEAAFHDSDLNRPNPNAVRLASFAGMSLEEWADLPLEQKGETAIRYFGSSWSGDTKLVKKWSDALPTKTSNQIKWLADRKR
jgi:hypothetical protein